MRVSWLTLAAVALLDSMLSGCGGGGSGGVASAGSTPPPPPAPANANLLGPLNSESFVNDASQASSPTSPLYPNEPVASAAAATFSYDAASKTYSWKVDGKTKTFAPADVNNAILSGSPAPYQILGLPASDTLTLTKAGTSGRFTYEYVGAALWQSITPSAQNASVYALAFGEPTAMSAVPHTGKGSFAIDLFGALQLGGLIEPFNGQGAVAVDFGTAALTIAGTINPNFQTSIFYGSGNLSSSGTLSGSLSLPNQVNGTFNGRLYGPQAQEIGGSFYGSNSSVAPNATAVTGAFLGRSGDPADIYNFSSMSAQALKADVVRQYGNSATAGAPGAMEVDLLPPVTSSTGEIVEPGTLKGKDYTAAVTFPNLLPNTPRRLSARC
jgi:hypothetical protein